MEEKRLECLMMLQIHRSDIDAVIDRFVTTAARRLNFLIWTNTKAKKAKQRCVMGVGMCLYTQLVQTN